MRKFFVGLVAGLLIGFLLAITTLAFAAPQAIKLIVNGQDIHPDVPPQLIDGRVMVPARFVAEPLGARVEWDGERNAVVISSNLPISTANEQTVQTETTLTAGDSFQTKENLGFTVLNHQYTNSFNPEFIREYVKNGVLEPQPGYKFFILSINITNRSSVYKEVDSNLLNNLFRIEPSVQDGRQWYMRPLDIDYNKLDNHKYLPPNFEIKANLIWQIPLEVNVSKVIIRKMYLGLPSDLILSF